MNSPDYKLIVNELEKFIEENDITPSHCDSFILHHPTLDSCDFCSNATVLQEERERLGVSNTGHSNRDWPCPADVRRSKEQYNAWPGNKPTTSKQLEERAANLRKELAKHFNDEE